MREIITLEIGQCGLQLGASFWDLVLREHASHSKKGLFDSSMSSFFRNVRADGLEIPNNHKQLNTFTHNNTNSNDNYISHLKARAILVDMEEGVINSTLRGSLSGLFDSNKIINDFSGAGNNFAHGHFVYGPQYGDSIMEKIRKESEHCDSLQSFFIIHSLGGGTGSGLGTYVLSLLADLYPDIYRFNTAIFPSNDDDVVTSPYNSVLSLAQLIYHADCVLPIDNEALINVCNKISKPMNNNHDQSSGSDSIETKASLLSLSTADDRRKSKLKKSSEKMKAFHDMNTVASHVLTNLTCGMRYPGELNVDLNEICTNLVPYPSLHFMIPCITPLYTIFNPITKESSYSSSLSVESKTIDSMFSSALHPDYQLIKSSPLQSTYISAAFLARGNVTMSDMQRNIQRVKLQMKLPKWNKDGFKIGICGIPPVNQSSSLLTLSNNSCMATVLGRCTDRLVQLYRVKAHLHHYLEYMEESEIVERLNSVLDVRSDYKNLSSASSYNSFHHSDSDTQTKLAPEL